MPTHQESKVTFNPVLSRLRSMSENDGLSIVRRAAFDCDTITLVSIEGNVCSGTRQMLEELRRAGYSVFLHDESTWDPGIGGVDDSIPARACVRFAHIARAIDALEPNDVKALPDGRPVVFVERWLGSTEQVFLRAASQRNVTGEGLRLWTELIRLLDLTQRTVDVHVYMNSCPNEAYQQLIDRAPALKDVALDYVNRIHEYYVDYMLRLTLTDKRVIRITDNDKNVNAFTFKLARLAV